MNRRKLKMRTRGGMMRGKVVLLNLKPGLRATLGNNTKLLSIVMHLAYIYYHDVARLFS